MRHHSPVLERISPRAARRRNRKITPRFFWSVAILFLGIYLMAGCVGNFRQVAQLNQEIARIEAEIRAFEERNARLRQQIAELESDEQVERIAREELGLVRPGETAYIVAPGRRPEGGDGSPDRPRREED